MWRVIAFIAFDGREARKYAFARFMAWARVNCCGKCKAGDWWAHLLEEDGAVELSTRYKGTARAVAKVLRDAPGLKVLIVDPNGEAVIA